MLRWILGGVIGGAVGAAIWAAIGYATNYEVGYIAWGVGFLVGLGVRYAAHTGGADESEAQGIGAALIAAAAVLAAKFALYLLLLGKFGALDMGPLESLRATEEDIIVLMADDLVRETEAQGKSITWPEGYSLEKASKKEHYPPAIWQRAAGQWNALSPEKQQERIDLRTAELKAVIAELRVAITPSFSAMFSPWDLLWFGLAMFTAYRLGNGSYGTE